MIGLVAQAFLFVMMAGPLLWAGELPVPVPSSLPITEEPVKIILTPEITEASFLTLEAPDSVDPKKMSITLKGSVLNPETDSQYYLDDALLEIKSDNTFQSVLNYREDIEKIVFTKKVPEQPDQKLIYKVDLLSSNDKSKKKFRFTPAIGFTSANYSQSNSTVSRVNALLLTVKFGVERKFNFLKWQDLSVGISGFLNVLQLSSSSPENAMRFLGLNLKIGKTTTLLSAPWSLGIAGGFYYLTMPTNGAFGFTNIFGPQIYPAVSREFSNHSKASAYFKFSPVTSGFSLLSLSSSEIALGGTYHFANSNWFVGFDLSSLGLLIPDSFGNSVSISSQTITISGGKSL